MNIFMTHPSPITSAKEHCLVHVRKMIIEYAQMLSTTHHYYETVWSRADFLYKKAHFNHPSTKWVRESSANYEWLLECWIALLYQYEKKYGKEHKSKRLAQYLTLNPMSNKRSLTSYREFTPLPCAMPEENKIYSNSILNYQYYLNNKFFEWQTRERPIKVEFLYGPPLWYNPGNFKYSYEFNKKLEALK